MIVDRINLIRQSLAFFVIGFGTDVTRRTTDATTVARSFRRERDRSNARASVFDHSMRVESSTSSMSQTVIHRS
jgi:hypothetical protein